MKNALIISLCSFGLSACSTLHLQYKEGEKVARAATDLASCKASALKQFPKDIRLRYLPPFYPPYGYYGPYSYYGYSSPQRYDANEGKRETAVKQCMADQGYIPAKIPACSAELAKITPAQTTVILPPLTENSCVIRYQSGGWQIVNPG